MSAGANITISPSFCNSASLSNVLKAYSPDKTILSTYNVAFDDPSNVLK